MSEFESRMARQLAPSIANANGTSDGGHAGSGSGSGPGSRSASGSGAGSGSGWGSPSIEAGPSAPNADDHQSDSDARIFAGLTDTQRQAVSIIHGPLLVLAAAGSGKTTVITRRIANILAHGIPPWAILALTFTNKSAGEMRERVIKLLPESIDSTGRGLTVTTFHSFCARVLRRYAEHVGLHQDYTIYDTADQKSAMKEALERLNLSKGNFPPDRVLSAISSAKNELKTPRAFAADADSFWYRHAARCYETYQQILQDNNAVDFDDLLLHVATLLRDQPAVREQMQRRFRYILIDEYQDTNHAQFVIAHALARTGERNICVVGDPDQSIYAWRGADISNILEFQRHYPDAQVVKLGENFRSTSRILKTADHLIKHNKRRKDKPLYTTKEGGEKPIVRACIDEHHEAHTVAEWFEELNADHGLQWRDMAIFYRTNALSRVLEAEFRTAGIPYTIVRGTAFFQRKEIKDALAYLRCIANPNDEVNLRRIVNTPSRGIGDQTLKKIDFFAIDHDLQLFDAMKRVESVQGLTKRATNAVLKFVRTIESWRKNTVAPHDDVFEPSEELATLIKRVLSESGMEAHFKKSGADEDVERLENLGELVTSAAEFEDELADMLAAASMANGESADGQAGDDDEFDPFEDPFGPLGDLSSFGDEDDLLGGSVGGEKAESTAAANAGASGSAMDDLFAEVRAAAAEGNASPRPTLLAKLRVYLERVTLIADADAVDSEAGSVLMMTLHAAKGLEFPAVAIVGLEEGLLPHTMSRDTDDDIEEERRLFFVGITRSKERLLITRAQSRAVRGLREATIASQFLSQLPQGDVEFEGDVFSSTAAGDFDIEARAPGMSGYVPKWKQMSQGRGRSRNSDGIEYDAEYMPSVPGAVDSTKYPVGSRVQHPQFGTGRVESVSRTGEDLRLRIKFDHVGMKTLIERFARLQRL